MSGSFNSAACLWAPTPSSTVPVRVATPLNQIPQGLDLDLFGFYEPLQLAVSFGGDDLHTEGAKRSKLSCMNFLNLIYVGFLYNTHVQTYVLYRL